jgi:hypothetical protein
MDIVKEIPLRARFEHNKSIPESRKTYITLGYTALPEGLFVQYYAEYDDDVILLREAEEFAGYTVKGKKRFTLIIDEVITSEVRDSLVDSDREEMFL